MSHDRFSAAELEAFRQTYQRDGVVHVPGLLSPEWTARLMTALQRARETLTGGAGAAVDPMKGRATAGANPGNGAAATAEFSQAPGRLTIRWLWRDDPEVRRFFTDSGVGPVVAAVIGARRLQYWYDLTFFHDPGADGAGSPWHHDIASFPCKGEQIPSLWIAMNDIGDDMSPLHCIRGSHRNPTQFRPPVYIDPDLELPSGYGDLPDVEARLASGEYQRLSWDIRAGDALLIHPYTLHGAPPNRSDKARVAFTTRWAGDDVTWRPDPFSMKVPGVDLARVPVGQRPDGPLFPYL
jgi:ectoine hydroxylase-related dioxygenase (phytanoyl-CoA dioxygenase family)